MSLTSREKKQMRQIAHHLDAVVTVADLPISEGVKEECDRALSDHELIKVKVALLEKEQRNTAGDDLATACEAEVVQRIGKMVILYRSNPKPNPRLSNMVRFT